MNVRAMRIFWILVLFTGAGFAASPPALVNYQGVLRDAGDAPLAGTYDMVFRFFSADVGGDEILIDTHDAGNGNPVSVTGGLFNVQLGGGALADGSGAGTYASLAEVFRDYGTVYLGLTVNGEVLNPRVQIIAAAYALNADHLDGMDAAAFLDTSGNAQTKTGALTVGGLTTTGDLLVNKTGTADAGVPWYNSFNLTLRGSGWDGAMDQDLDMTFRLSGTDPTDYRLGLFNDAGTEVASIDETGDLSIGDADGMDSDFLFFDQQFEFLSWDGTDSRFEVSDDLAIAGSVRTGSLTSLTTYNSFGTRSPDSGAITSPSDVMVAWDLEIGSLLFLSRTLYMEGDASAGLDADQSIYFYESGSRIGERFFWDDSMDAFSFSDDFVFPQTTLFTSTGGGGELRFASMGNSMRFVVDSNNNSSFLSSNHTFTWYRDTSTFFSGNRLMELSSHDQFIGSADGRLYIRDSLVENMSFDIAESFFQSEPVEPGDLVRVDPDRGDAVRLTAGENDPTVLGAVSTKPGIILGGGAFTVQELRETWGDVIADLFEAERAALWNELITRSDDLKTRHEELRSSPGASDPEGARDPEEIEARARELAIFEADLESLALKVFFHRRFASVALSGRVPVKVDSGFGAIRAGDLLAPSPAPGTAMRASKPGPIIGTALEDFDGGEGKVLTFIHRGWYAPDPADRMAEVQERLTNQIAERTPDPISGIQQMSGNLQVVLDADANEHSRLSVFRDGGHGLREELLRLDEEGNLRLKGAIMPTAMDLAEYHPVSAPVSVGDVLVVDRSLPGVMRPGDVAADAAVVGIVSGEPGILLGSGITRLAEADPEIASKLELARDLHDHTMEADLWAALEEKFEQTHAPIALSGTVPCKVDAGYGPVAVGDLLVASPTPGHAMRTDDPAPGTVIGKALEPLDQGTGMVKVLVMLR